jgi:ACT domain
MSTPRSGHSPADRPAHRSHRHELIELAALFGTAAVADLLSDLLGHRTEGPGLLACLSVALIAVLFAHRVWTHRGTSPPSPVSSSGSPGLDHGDNETGTLWRIRTSVEDTPGRLAVLAGALAAAGANILTMQVHPTGSGATDEFLVRTPPDTPAAKLAAALSAAGGGEPWVGRADVHALVDAPAQALVLARLLLAGPGGDVTGDVTGVDRLPLVLAELLRAAEVEWLGDAPGRAQSAPASAPEGIDGAALRLRVPGRGVLLVTRPGLPFTPAEYARARAMADLALSDPALPGQTDAGTAATSGPSPSSSSVSEASCAPRV